MYAMLALSIRLQGRCGAELRLHVDLTPSKGYRLRAMKM